MNIIDTVLIMEMTYKIQDWLSECVRRDGKNNYEGSGLLYYSALGLIGLAVFLIAKTIFN